MIVSSPNWVQCPEFIAIAAPLIARRAVIDANYKRQNRRKASLIRRRSNFADHCYECDK